MEGTSPARAIVVRLDGEGVGVNGTWGQGMAGECKRFNTEDTEEMREGTEAAGMGCVFRGGA